jgi:hypothetical protein
MDRNGPRRAASDRPDRVDCRADNDRATLFKLPIQSYVWPFFALLIVGFVLANIALFNEKFTGSSLQSSPASSFVH